MTRDTIRFDGEEYPVLGPDAVSGPADVDTVAVRRDRETYVAVTAADGDRALNAAESHVLVNGEAVTGFVLADDVDGLY